MDFMETSDALSVSFYGNLNKIHLMKIEKESFGVE